jgi:hypothetical protein
MTKNNGLIEALNAITVFDVHTHLDATQMSARGLHNVLLYHMVISDLYAAGCPSGNRLSWIADKAKAHNRIKEALPYLKYIQNTSCFWGVKIILKDLYGWDKPITEDNWQKIDSIIREKSTDSTWAREILKKANIARCGTELCLRGDGSYDDVLDYALEWAFFMRTQWGQNDIPLFELERTWEDTGPTPPLPVTLDRLTYPRLKKTIKTVADVHKAMKHYCDLIPYDEVLATAQHLSTEMNYREVTDDQMQKALDNRDNATEEDCDTYASYLMYAFLEELEKHSHEIVFQFSLAAEALPHESASICRQETILQLSKIIQKFPKLKFQCTLASRHANQSLCTLARELPNFSLSGYWWHSFFPGAIKQVMEERLDMLPANKQIGFFSDAYHVDWCYAKSVIVRRQLAHVLSQKIDQGQYSIDDALQIAKQILYQAPQQLLGMKPSHKL